MDPGYKMQAIPMLFMQVYCSHVMKGKKGPSVREIPFYPTSKYIYPVHMSLEILTALNHHSKWNSNKFEQPGCTACI